MDRRDPQPRNDRRPESPGPEFVVVPSVHAGVENALHHAFGSPDPLPDEWRRLLGRLR